MNPGVALPATLETAVLSGDPVEVFPGEPLPRGVLTPRKRDFPRDRENGSVFSQPGLMGVVSGHLGLPMTRTVIPGTEVSVGYGRKLLPPPPQMLPSGDSGTVAQAAGS